MRKIKNNILRFPTDRAIEVNRQHVNIKAFNHALGRIMSAEAPCAPWLLADDDLVLDFNKTAEIVSLCEFRKTKKIEKSG